MNVVSEIKTPNQPSPRLVHRPPLEDAGWVAVTARLALRE